MSDSNIYLLPNDFIRYLLHELTTNSAIHWSAPDELFDTWGDWWEYNFDLSNVEEPYIMRQYILTTYNHDLGRVDHVHSLEYIEQLMEELSLIQEDDANEIDGTCLCQTCVNSLRPCTRAFISILQVEFEETLELENTLLYQENVLRQELEGIVMNHLRQEQNDWWDAQQRRLDIIFGDGVNRNGYQRYPEWLDEVTWWECGWVGFVRYTRRWESAVELVGWVFLTLNG